MNVYNPTPEQCIEAVQTVAQELGRTPSTREYDSERSDDHPSSYAVRRAVGSWMDALEAADRELSDGRCKPGEYGLEDVIELAGEVCDVVRERGYVTQGEYRQTRESFENPHPSVSTIQEYIQSWPELMLLLDRPPTSNEDVQRLYYEPVPSAELNWGNNINSQIRYIMGINKLEFRTSPQVSTSHIEPVYYLDEHDSRTVLETFLEVNADGFADYDGNLERLLQMKLSDELTTHLEAALPECGLE